MILPGIFGKKKRREIKSRASGPDDKRDFNTIKRLVSYDDAYFKKMRVTCVAIDSLTNADVGEANLGRFINTLIREGIVSPQIGSRMLSGYFSNRFSWYSDTSSELKQILLETVTNYVFEILNEVEEGRSHEE